MTNRDSTQTTPPLSPHDKYLSHPLVPAHHTQSFLDCLDMLDNAANLLDLFRHLDLDKNGEHGGLSSGATCALSCLVTMLEDTLNYIGHNLENAWRQKQGPKAFKGLRHSVVIKALQQSTAKERTEVCSHIASLLNVASADIEAFLAMLEQPADSTSEVKEPAGVYLVQ